MGDVVYVLEGKTAIVTGGTAGIGRSIAIAFAKAGARVAIFGTSPEKANTVLDEIRKVSSLEPLAFCLDISNTTAVLEAIEKVLHAFGNVDILVNNAGITKDQLLMKMSEEDWDRVLDVNLKSLYNTAKAIVRPMMKARKGVLLNMSSIIGLMGNAGQSNYAAAKAGIHGFTKSLAKELASRNIRVNCIAPGYIDTPMTESLPLAVKEAILEKIPLQRMGTPEDIASVALFLVSDAASYITGQILAVDGGMVMNS